MHGAFAVVLEMVASLGMLWEVGENSKVCVLVVYNLAIDSSNGGGECWELEGRDTSSYISSLLSALKEKVGKVIVQVLFSLCSKHPQHISYVV